MFRVKLFFIFFIISNLTFATSLKERPVVTVYGHSSIIKSLFDSKTNLKKIFEDKCSCELKILGLDSSGIMLSRLILEGENTSADVVVGLDVNQLSQAESTGLFQDIDHIDTSKLILPIKWENKKFVPYNFGYFSFIYNKDKVKKVPESFNDLIYGDNNIKIIMQDPRSSSVGFGFLVWLNLVFGENAGQAIKKLQTKVVTITKGWGESYALFLKGEADMVSSYTTSPAYHMIHENNFSYESSNFLEGHYLQIEVVGKLKNAKHPKLADMFVEFLLLEKVQRYIPSDNFAYPVVDLKTDMPEEYNFIKKPDNVIFIDHKTIHKQKIKWFKEWLTAFTD